jgi:hypothetical protein
MSERIGCKGYSMEMTVTTPTVPVGGMQGENYVYHDTRLSWRIGAVYAPTHSGQCLVRGVQLHVDCL